MAKAGGARPLRWLVRLVGPVVLAVLVWRFSSFDEIRRTLGHADLRLVSMAVLLNGVVFFFKVVRWQALLRERGLDYPTGRAWTSFMSSAYLGMVTPGRVGDALRAQYLRHDIGLEYPRGLAIVLVDRLCDLYVLLLFVAVGMVRFGSVIGGTLAWALWLGVVGTILGPSLLLLPGLADKLGRRAWSALRAMRAPSKVAGGDGVAADDAAAGGAAGFDAFLETLRAMVSVRLAWPLAITAVAFAVNYLQAWLLASAIGLSFGFVDVLSLMAIASMLSLLPVSVSGVGVRELFFALAFPMLRASPEAGVSYGLLVFATMHVVVAIAGFVSWQVAPPPVEATRPDAASPGRG